MAQPAASEHLPVEVLKISAEAPERNVIDYAASFIKRGRVIGIPTDTFYGLSADPFNLAAIERVFQVKGRPENKRPADPGEFRRAGRHAGCATFPTPF